MEIGALPAADGVVFEDVLGVAASALALGVGVPAERAGTGVVIAMDEVVGNA